MLYYANYWTIKKHISSKQTAKMIENDDRNNKVYNLNDCMHAREESNSVAKMRGSKDISDSWETKRNDHILLRTGLVQGEAFKALQGQGKN
jgi:hypothetical protein